MKKDIQIPQVHNVFVAAVPEDNDEQPLEWWIVLINNTDGPLENVLVNSRGYSSLEHKSGRTTSQLRKSIQVLPAKSAVRLEPIMPEVFDLFNEYWVTFFENEQLKDRKFIFGPHTIEMSMCEDIPIVAKKGILIK